MGIALYSCVKDIVEIEPNQSASESGVISVAEAKEFFENQIALQATRGGGRRKPSILDPGEFTPHWNRAKSSSGKRTGGVSAPISQSTRHGALRCETINGKPAVAVVPVYQKVVVVKSAVTGEMSTYLLSLVPTVGFHRHNKNYNADHFVIDGDKGDFSGIAAYYTLGGRLIKLDEYANGTVRRGVHTIGPRPVDKSKVAAMLRGIQINSKPNIATRSGGEDDDDCGWSWDDFSDWLEDYLGDPNAPDHFYWEADSGEPPWSPGWEDNGYDYTQGGEYGDWEDWGGEGWDWGQYGGDGNNGSGQGLPPGWEVRPNANGDGQIYVKTESIQSGYRERYWIDTDGDGMPDQEIGVMIFVLDDIVVEATKPGGNGNPNDGDTEETTEGTYCPTCGSTECDGDCEDGDGNNNNNNTVHSLKYDNNEAKMAIEDALQKIMSDCMGSTLMDNLASVDLHMIYRPFVPDDPDPPIYDGEYDRNTKTMTIVEGADEYTVLEELFHAYQDNNYWASNKGDNEIEAKIAKLYFSYRHGDYNYGTDWDSISDFVRNPCEETWDSTVSALVGMGYFSNRGYTFSSYANFHTPNLDALITEC
ncbi:hypothetical protein FACS1894159_06990 [Bacteroidia bacterium]|nr:hypothetical protein FACS1894159_06990 [Bacteroidia bacterium]